MDEQTITLSPCSVAKARNFTREQYEGLKQSGLLWELYPNAPTSWPFRDETKSDEVETLRAELSATQIQRDKFVDYSVWLQRLVEHLCRGIPVTEDITFHAPYHAQMAKNKQAEETSEKDHDYLKAYIKMVEEEFPHTPYWDGTYWCYPYEMRGEGGFGGGVGEAKFYSFYEAMDSAMKISFNP